jgi:tRNA pseudouridine38-40 synthase
VPTFKLTIEYDGGGYAGWQRQLNRPTVQEAMENALRSVAQSKIGLIGAGRTDAGVHALGQVASFRADTALSAEDWTRALNAVLPADISVRSTDIAADRFHARRSAQSKLYAYRILNRRERSALERDRAWHIRSPLDMEAMRAAAVLLVGRHDFTSFQGHPTDTKDPVCDLTRLEITRTGDVVRLEVCADIVGTLVEVGRGKRPPASVKDILAARDRREAGRTAPAHGLYLVSVEY